MKTIKELAQAALDVQNASNLTAVFLGAHEAAKELRTLGVASTADVNEHPIVLLWAAKIADLSGLPYHWPNDSETAVKNLAELGVDS